MKQLSFFFLILLTGALNAQQSYFNASKFNTELPGKLLLKSGELKDVRLWYDHPDFLKRDDVVLKADTGPINKASLIAFSIDGHTWVPRAAPTGNVWVVLSRQGAIEVYDYVTTDSGGKNSAVITMGTAINKGSTQLIQSALLLTYKKSMASLVSDYPELASKVGGKGYGFMQYLNVVDEYNAWFEKNNSEKTTYLPTSLGVPIPANATVKGFGGFKAQLQENKAASVERSKRRVDSLFVNRSSVVAPEMASAKDNIPVKKETFSAKIARINADGNKVGVVLNLMPARTVQNETGVLQMSNLNMAEGGYLDESVLEAGQQLVEELNQAYQTTFFELVDFTKIPYREIKVLGQQTRVDDWWATKYKVVFVYTIDPRIEANSEDINGQTKTVSAINFIQSLMVTEYLGAPSSTKQDILTQVLDFGGFRTLSYTHRNETRDPEEIYIRTLSKLEVPVLDKIRIERAAGVKKLTEKRLTP